MNAVKAMKMMNQSLLMQNIKNDLPRQLKSEQLITDGYIDTSDLSNVEAPIDLSRRCDSVETRKTPSPYNSSAFGESSPSQLNDSPNSLTRSSSNFGPNSAHNRVGTPTNRYQSAAYIQRNFTSSTHDSTRFPYDSDRTPSPESMPLHHHRYMREQSMSGNEEEINPYFLHAVALQQKLHNIPNDTVPTNEQLTADALQYPMILGRDGKMARPFKAYPRDPLSISAAIPTSDSITDRMSAERFSIFRQQMLEQIHAANGGRPTVTNPKMRRVSMKSDRDDMEFASQQSDIDIESQSGANQTDSTTNAANNNSSSKDSIKDSAYYERRRKNNAAAKKSRDRRRIKEDEIAIRAAFLERENFELKIELATAKRQLAKFLEK